VIPYRLGRAELRQTFADQIVRGDNTEFIHIDQTIASQAAELRSRYNLNLLDALQVAELSDN
jgi:predicted nucleic acid-binding protein